MRAALADSSLLKDMGYHLWPFPSLIVMTCLSLCANSTKTLLWAGYVHGCTRPIGLGTLIMNGYVLFLSYAIRDEIRCLESNTELTKKMCRTAKFACVRSTRPSTGSHSNGSWSS